MFNINMSTQARANAHDGYNYQQLDEEGFLIDPHDWEPSFSEGRATEMKISLTKEHWDLINLIRYKYLALGALPSMRSVCKKVGFEKHELKNQFGSCLRLWKLAGLPDPGEEAKTYMG